MCDRNSYSPEDIAVEYSVISAANDMKTVQSKQRNDRVFIRFSALVVSSATPPDDIIAIMITNGNALDSTVVATLTPSNPTAELDWKRHGQLVSGPFTFQSALGAAINVYIADGIVTGKKR